VKRMSLQNQAFDPHSGVRYMGAIPHKVVLRHQIAYPNNTPMSSRGLLYTKAQIRTHVFPLLQRRQQALRMRTHVPHAVLPEEKPERHRAVVGRATFAAHDVDERLHAQNGVALRDLDVLGHQLVQVVARGFVALERRPRARWGVEFGGEAPGHGDHHAHVKLFELDGERLSVC
jgi:hypothetical protein